tara:strand:+ start:665 stop:928 length:264 start_codon:yes stop_codon:yes gene_type:complete
MNWIWGEKKNTKATEKTKMDFTAKNRRRDLITRTVKVHLELQMEYPGKMDIVQGIRDTKTSFDLPPGIELKDAHLAHIEVLGEPNAK